MKNPAGKAPDKPGSGNQSRRLANAILELIQDHEMQPGDRLKEQQLASEFAVSRTPVRTALSHLASLGVVERRPNLGHVLLKSARDLHHVQVDVPPSPDQILYRRLVQDHLAGRLREPLTQTAIETNYGYDRPVVLAALRQLSNDGLIVRHGARKWVFLPSLDAEQGLAASYELRLTVEPEAILLPGFVARRDLLNKIRQRHEHILAQPHLDSVKPIDLFETDASFHEALAACSGNPFFVQIVEQQNRLRRLLEFSSYGNGPRVSAWCLEHLAILDAVQADDRAEASRLLRAHLLRGMAEGRENLQQARRRPDAKR